MNSFEWIWQYAKKNKNKLLLAVIFVVINAILIVIIPLLSGRIVDQVINQGKTEELVPILGIMIGVTVIGQLFVIVIKSCLNRLDNLRYLT